MAYEQKPSTGTLFKNKNKSTEKHPDYTGVYVDGDGVKFSLAAWVKSGERGTFLSLATSEWRDKGAAQSHGKNDFTNKAAPIIPLKATAPDELPF